MSNRLYTQFNYSLHKAPVVLDLRFQVAAADTGGKGIINLAGAGIQAVYMHTSATPSAGNPNPAAGTIIVQLQDSYFRFLGFEASMRSPLSGTGIVITAAGAHIVAGTPYVITVVGTSTLADWQAIGLPVGITPAVGVPFIGSSTTGSGTGSGQVQVIKSTGSGIDHVELAGDPQLTLNPSGFLAAKPYLIFNCDLSLVKTQPTDDSWIFMKLLLSNSNIMASAE